MWKSIKMIIWNNTVSQILWIGIFFFILLFIPIVNTTKNNIRWIKNTRKTSQKKDLFYWFLIFPLVFYFILSKVFQKLFNVRHCYICTVGLYVSVGGFGIYSQSLAVNICEMTFCCHLIRQFSERKHILVGYSLGFFEFSMQCNKIPRAKKFFLVKLTKDQLLCV